MEPLVRHRYDRPVGLIRNGQIEGLRAPLLRGCPRVSYAGAVAGAGGASTVGLARELLHDLSAGTHEKDGNRSPQSDELMDELIESLFTEELGRCYCRATKNAFNVAAENLTVSLEHKYEALYGRGELPRTFVRREDSLENLHEFAPGEAVNLPLWKVLDFVGLSLDEYAAGGFPGARPSDDPRRRDVELTPRAGSRTTASHLASSSGEHPCLSLPRSSAQPSRGKANSSTIGAVGTVSSAMTGVPAARSSSMAAAVSLRHSHGTCSHAPRDVFCTVESSGVAV